MKKPYFEITLTPRLDWVPLLFLCITPVLAISLAAYDLHQNGLTWAAVLSFWTMYWISGLGITVAYHRYYAHRTFECGPITRFFILMAGTASFENSVLKWASNHRFHHQFQDTEGDPYNIRKGFFYAHFGWMLYKNPPNRPYANGPDLKKDKLVIFQDRYYLPLVVLICFGVPTLIGAAFGHALSGLIWGGLVRMVVVHHITFLINSWAHTFGRKTYGQELTAKDSFWLGVISFGEGFHSYHHAFPADYRIGPWYAFDPGKWVIGSLKALGLARALKQATPERIALTRRTAAQEEVSPAPRELKTPAIRKLPGNLAFDPVLDPKVSVASTRIRPTA